MLIKNKKEKTLSKSISYISNNSTREMASSSSKQASDKVIGKVSIKREDLIKFNAKDHWFKLTPVTEDSEVSGQILFSVKLIDQLINKSASGNKSASQSTDKKLTVRVLECDNLTLINGTCDPFVVVTLNCLTKRKRSDADKASPDKGPFGNNQETIKSNQENIKTKNLLMIIWKQLKPSGTIRDRLMIIENHLEPIRDSLMIIENHSGNNQGPMQ